MLYEQLTEQDKDLILHYIEKYNEEFGQVSEPLDYLLRFWNEAKEDLFHKFKNRLIIKEKIQYNKDENALRLELNNLNATYWRFKDEIFSACSKESWRDIVHLFTIDVLLENKCKAAGSITILQTGKVIKYQKETKPLRIIGKIAKSIGQEEAFYYFHTDYSKIVNTKSTHEENLCFSIHPLDFLTMSDNNNSWSSCMSWKKQGCYRQGTIEMMNSPCVVVAYLTSSAPYRFDYAHLWNNKKWRCLFIVDKDFIISVKEYPTANSALCKAVLEKLIEILGWGSATAQQVYGTYGFLSTDKNIEIKLGFNTVYMYNDFGCANYYYFAINPEYNENSLENDYYNYSGESECMCCGESLDGYLDDETAFVSCKSCDEKSYYCDICGKRLKDDDESITWIDDTPYCECCADRYACLDEVTGEVFLKEESIQIKILGYYYKVNKNTIGLTNEWNIWFNYDFTNIDNPEGLEFNEEDLTEAGKKRFKPITDLPF